MAGQISPLRRRGSRLGAGLFAGVLVLGLGTACTGKSLKDAEVVLSDTRAATVTTGSGEPRPAVDGERLHGGDRVRTGPNGAATLTVRSRRVLLGKSTDVTVPDGGTLTLTEGAVLVDRRHGPAVTIQAGRAKVDRIEPGALRLERSYAVELAVYSGKARITTFTGRRLSVPALHRTVVSGGASASAPSPLALAPGDTWEQLVIPGVVVMDEKLTQLARGIDAGWTQPVPSAAVPAAFQSASTQPPSERVLPRAIGEAAARRGLRADPFGQAARLRKAGGSWGVVAALLDTNLAGVSTALSDLLRGVPPTVVAPTPGTGLTPSPTPGRTPRPGETPGPRPTRSGPTSSPSPRPTSPSPESSIDKAVKEIEKQLPTPPPTTPPPARPGGLGWLFS